MFAQIKQVITAMLAVSVLALTAGVAASQEMAKESHSRVPGPQYTLPKMDEKCVHDPDFKKTGKCEWDTAFMRRNHMKLMLHKRDETMHQGVRSKTASLKDCVNCHVTKDETGKPIKVSNPKHFCASCHQYVAVKLDCFECHRSTPDTPASTASIPRDSSHANLLASNAQEAVDLSNFLKGVAK